MFAELLAHEGVEELCELRSPFGLMAFHGGNLEHGTDQVALAAASRADASVYAVLQPPGLRWHVPSTAVRPAESDRLAQFIDHVDVAVAVHGYGAEGYWTTLLLGGRNRALATHVGAALRAELARHDFEVIDALDDVPSRLRGVHRDNPVNLPRDGGVQLELPPRVRGTSPMSKPEYTEALIAGLAAAASTWPVTVPGD